MKKYKKGEKLIIKIKWIPEDVHAVFIEYHKNIKNKIIIRIEDSFLEDINQLEYIVNISNVRKYKER